MAFLFLFLGGIGGFAASSSLDPTSLALALLFSFLCLLWAIAKKGHIAFLLGFGALLGVGLFFRFVPIDFGKEEVTGMVIKTGQNYVVLRTLTTNYYVYSSGHCYQVGDILRISGTVKELRITTYESQFSFDAYLRSLGARAEVSYPSVKEVFCLPLRLGVKRASFLSSFKESSKALLDAVLFGRKDYSNALVSKANELSLLFVLSSSGLFYSFFLRLFERLLCLRLKEKTASIVTLVLACLLLPLNIEKIGLWRVFLMRLVGFIDAKKRRLSYLNRLGLTGVILIALNPWNALASGLWIGAGLSFCRYFVSVYLEGRKKRYVIVQSYVFVQLFLLPLTLSNGEFHLTSIVFAPLLLPLVGIFAFLGIISFITVPFTPLLEGYTSFLSSIVSLAEKFDMALPFPPLGSVTTFLLYAVFACCLFLHEMGFARVKRGLLFGVAIVYVTSLLPAGYLGLEAIYFINVGQGDSTLVYNRGTAVMIDTGGVVGMDIAKETLIPYLRKKRIYHLDALIITHGDYDHYGGRDSLRANYNVKRVIEDASSFPLRIGNLYIENHNAYGGSEANDRSLVLDVKLKKWRLIVTGDAPVEIETKILQEGKDLDCDILKVGHHGSNTSTCDAWLDALTPSTAVISCARKNSYGHPSSEVLKRLNDRHIDIRRTDLEGSVEFASFG